MEVSWGMELQPTYLRDTEQLYAVLVFIIQNTLLKKELYGGSRPLEI